MMDDNNTSLLKSEFSSVNSCEISKLSSDNYLLDEEKNNLKGDMLSVNTKLDSPAPKDACDSKAVINSDVKSEQAGLELVSLDKINDPYAYIDRNGFTSEKFKIEIKGLPKYYGIGQLKKLLNTKLKLGSNKIKPPKMGSKWIFVCFRSEEDREGALKVLNGLKWKNSILTATAAKPAPDPLVKRRNEAQDESNKRQKVDDQRSQEEKVKDSTVPLWRLSPDSQAIRKTEITTKVLRNMVYDIEKQNQSLKTYFNDQREKNGGAPLKMYPLVRSPSIDGYRNKCEFTIGINEETGEKTVGMRLGSYATGTVGVASVYGLPHVPDLMKQAVRVFEGFVRTSPLAVFNPETYTGHWRQLTVRLGINTQQLMLIVGIHPQKLTQEEIDSLKCELQQFFTSGEGQSLNVTSLYYQEITKRQSGAEQGVELVSGEGHITELLCGLRFNISPLSFFQVNTGAAELLFEAVSSLTQLTEQTTLVDVCCGIGSIGLCLAKKCGQVLGLELMEQAVKDARQNAALNGVTNCEFFSGPAEEILQSVVDRAKFENVVAVVDPPRAGLRQNAVVMLRRISKIKKIAYLACNIKSAAKNMVDLARPASKTLAGAPFVPVAVTPVDMFPHTEHCEVIIYLERLEEA